MNKVPVPLSHYQFYQKVYTYLHESLGVQADAMHLKTGYRKILNNYYQRLPEKIANSNFLTPPENFLDQSTSFKDPLPNKLRQKNKLADQVKSCQDCGLWKGKMKDVPFGERHSSVMVITDIPSYFDQISGRHFSDKSGELMKKILKALNINLEETYITSTVKCFSTKELPNDLGEILRCARFFKEEVDTLRPELILAFGQNTYKMMHQGKSSNNWRGVLEHYQGISILFTHHPRDLLFDPTLKKETWSDLQKIQPLLHALQTKIV